MDIARTTSVSSVGFSASWTPLWSAPGGALPVEMDTALRGSSLAVCTLKRLERESCVFLRFFLVGFVLLYEALSDCAKFPCLTLNLGQSAHYTSTNRTVAVLLYILYLLGQFTKRAI